MFEYFLDGFCAFLLCATNIRSVRRGKSELFSRFTSKKSTFLYKILEIISFQSIEVKYSRLKVVKVQKTTGRERKTVVKLSGLNCAVSVYL